MDRDETVNRHKIEVKDLVLMGACVAFIAICAFMTIPTVVPFTLQTFAIFFVLLLLGGKKGTITIVAYVLLGTLGVPVFAGFTGGPGVVFGLTGGYIVGFILTGVIYLLLTMKEDTKLIIKILALIIGLLVCYTYGTVWFIHVYTKNTGAIGVWQALTWCVLPFIPFDAIKLAAAVLIGVRVQKIIKEEENK